MKRTQAEPETFGLDVGALSEERRVLRARLKAVDSLLKAARRLGVSMFAQGPSAGSSRGAARAAGKVRARRRRKQAAATPAAE
jgi:hypothetical protein